MPGRNLSLFVVLLSVFLTATQAQTPQPSAAQPLQSQKSATETAAAESTPLDNSDILAMLRAGLSTEVMLIRIRGTGGNYDFSPAALRELKAAGAADAIIVAMLSSASARSGAESVLSDVTLPAGTAVEVEVAHEVNSASVKKGDAISFRVVRPVRVDAMTVIRTGALVTGWVESAGKGRRWGRAGHLSWRFGDVVAVDGQSVSVQWQAAAEESGDVRLDRSVGLAGTGIVYATIIGVPGVGLVMAAPFLLRQGLKRGSPAILPEGKRFTVLTRQDAVISVARERDDGQENR